MGPIQSSLNQLTLSAIGAVGGLAHSFKGVFAKPKAQETKAQKPETQPTTEITNSMGNIAKIGRNYSRTYMRSYEAAARSVEAGNEVIDSKAKSHFSPVTARLEEVNKAIASFSDQGKEDKE